MNKYLSLPILIAILTLGSVHAQNIYTADLSAKQAPVLSGHLKLGTHINAAGHTLYANSLYFIKDGKPWYPVMGEFHFSRYPRKYWEESILKMKAAGVDVIATYVFWIYHEEEEGKFDWTDNRDLKYFAQLCQKHGMYLVARIGPWCHGEVRNGAFPDWLVKRGNLRKNNAGYLGSVQKLYNAIGEQLKGLYFKDGGPVIGAQIENEFRFNNPAGLEHILTLKQMAIKAGIDVPFYTATGWPGSNLKQDELVPVWGGYPEAPWDKRTTTLPLSENYVFSTLRNDPAIGSDLLGKHQDGPADYQGYRYPYATAEMGSGIQITYHRRPIIEPVDVAALAYVKVGSGANLMGYYMFHGGSDPIGKFSTLQESKATHYPNDYPIISYDFQAPVGEFGQLRPSYRYFKVLHSFLNDFGDQLVKYYPYFPDRKPVGPTDSMTLRFAVRARDSSGFVFISNYQRQLHLKEQNNVQFSFKTTGNKSTNFPEQGISIPSGTQAILPFNMNIEGCNLQYATVQPLCKVNGEIPTYVFFAPEGIRPEYVFNDAGISKLTASNATVLKRNHTYLVNDIQPGTNCIMTLNLASGKQVNVITLTQQQALDSWKGNALGAEHLFISEQNITFLNGKVQLQSWGDNQFNLSVYPTVKKLNAGTKTPVKWVNDGVFSNISLSVPQRSVAVKFKPVTDIGPYQNKGVQLPSDDRSSKYNGASPGPQYQTNLTAVDGAKYWEINVAPTVGRALLNINYQGDTGSAYVKGKLVADDFYDGKTMQTEVPVSGKPFNLLLQVVPLTNERQIYFEKGIREPLQGTATAQLQSVKVMPLYKLTISTGN